MTAKKDLKKRVRERQARTGESYVTARQQVVARRPGEIPVVQLTDLTAEAKNLGLRGKVLATEELLERVPVEPLLARLRDALVATADDPKLAAFRDVLIGGLDAAALNLPHMESLVEGLRFIARARAGIGGPSENGRLLALPVAGRGGIEMVVCTVWTAPTLRGVQLRAPSVMMATPESFIDGVMVWLR